MKKIKFKCGDEVKLKSDGPVMTVTKITPNILGRSGEVWVECIWFDSYKRKHNHNFNPNELELFTIE